MLRFSRVAPGNLFALLLFVANLATAQEATKAATPDVLQTILDRVHEHAATKSWREEGWKDERIERWLEVLTENIGAAANSPAPKLPVRFADVKPSEEIKPQTLKNTLIVGRNFNFRSTKLSRCIVLADGNVMADSLDGCVVVARGAVSAASTANSVVVAGAYVRTTSDGQSRSLENGSLLVTPGWAHIDSVSGTIVLAEEGITTGGRVDGGIFVNATLVLSDATSSTSQRRPRSVKVHNLPLGDLINHPISKQLEILGIIYPEAIEPPPDRFAAIPLLNQNNTLRPRPTGLVMRFEGRRYVVNLGKPIVTQSREPVTSLSGWKLSYVNDKIAILSKDDSDAIVRIGD